MVGGLSREEGGTRNKMGLRNIAEAFNHRGAVRPGFSPTGAKRQMGSITAIAGHTHTTSTAISIREHRRGEPNGRRNGKDSKMSRGKKEKKISQ